MKDRVFRENMFSGETRSSRVILTSALEGKYVKGEMAKLENIFDREEEKRNVKAVKVKGS